MTIGVLPAHIDADVPLIVMISSTNGGKDPLVYKSIDGGLSWTGFGPGKPPQLDDVNRIENECISSCQFIDPLNELIQYRIMPGKYLYRSIDGGQTWSDELYIPAWNQMQKTYVKTKFDTFPAYGLERGPFSAVTDPKTGNIVLAMGLEGVFVRTPDGELHRAKVPYSHKINPSRLEMIGLIEKQEWWRGLVIALLVILFGLYQTGMRRFGGVARLVMVLAVLFIVIPYDLLVSAFLLGFGRLFEPWSIFYDAYEPILAALNSPIIIIPMIAIILVNLLKSNRSTRPPLLPLAAVAVGTMIGYWLPILAWSQGILLTEYQTAARTGIAIVFAGIVLTFILIKKPSFTQPPLDPSSAVR